MRGRKEGEAFFFLFFSQARNWGWAGGWASQPRAQAARGHRSDCSVQHLTPRACRGWRVVGAVRPGRRPHCGGRGPRPFLSQPTRALSFFHPSPRQDKNVLPWARDDLTARLASVSGSLGGDGGGDGGTVAVTKVTSVEGEVRGRREGEREERGSGRARVFFFLSDHTATALPPPSLFSSLLGLPHHPQGRQKVCGLRAGHLPGLGGHARRRRRRRRRRRTPLDLGRHAQAVRGVCLLGRPGRRPGRRPV